MNKNRLTIILLLLALVGMEAVLHLHNLSPYLIYPDSYQSLIVAENIRHGYGLVGRLGEGGMWYPDTFWWTRPAYAFLISIFSGSPDSVINAARNISFAAGLLVIPMTYLMLKMLWDRRSIAILGAGLVGVSYALAVWGGFVQTEALGVLAMTTLLAGLFAVSRRKSDNMLLYLALGGLFGLAIAVRYEYAAMAVPIIYWIYADDRKDWWLRAGSILAGALLVMSSVFYLLGPIPFSLSDVLGAARSFILPILGTLVIIGATVWTLRKYRNLREKLIILIPYVLATLAGLSLLVGGIGNFVSTDFLICALGLYGLSSSLQHKESRRMGVFALISILLLSAVYYEVNPEMQRYWTHILPFLAIAASYGAWLLVTKVRVSSDRTYRITMIIVGSLMLAAQIGMTWQGLHDYKDGLWYRAGYEEVAARKTKDLLPKDAIVIASTPEPYHLFTRMPTQSVAPDAPYLYMPSDLDGRKVAVVNDESMRFYFPKFSSLLESSLQRYKTHQFFTGEPLREKNEVITERKPVEIYILPLKTLKDAIARQGRP